MTSPVNVLVYGALDGGSCDVFRAGMFRDHLAALGVNLRPWTELGVYFAPGYEGRPEEAFRDGAFEIDRSALDWADVIVFRRYYFTAFACESGDAASLLEADMVEHARVSGHRYRRPLEVLLRPMWARLLKEPSFLGGRAIVYETDDHVLATPTWFGSAVAAPETDIVRSMLKMADLVTVSTPTLERMAREHNGSVRLIRNAIEPDWYPDPASVPDREGSPRILFYGVPQRLRDYAVCRDAVDEVVRSTPGARRIWLGGDEPALREVADELQGFVRGAPAFARSLVEARPDIGLCPVADDEYNRARSELHWLEYSMAGAPSVATRLMGGGPYEVIRDGVDGLLARNKAQWRDALRSLARSPALRAELAGRARERVRAEYRAADRAVEWADAYRWAAEHARSRARAD
jgi:glycosyltransferase involved in cell wall biosynthesis